MALKSKKVRIGDRDIVLHELSFMAQLRMSEIQQKQNRKPTNLEIYKECMSDEDFKLLEQAGREESEALQKAFGELHPAAASELPLSQKTENGK